MEVPLNPYLEFFPERIWNLINANETDRPTDSPGHFEREKYITATQTGSTAAVNTEQAQPNIRMIIRAQMGTSGLKL